MNGTPSRHSFPSRYAGRSRVVVHQRGAVLFVGLIMLLLLTLIGITAMQVTLMQERMASNFYAQHDGFERGESALAVGRDAARVEVQGSGPLLFGDYMSLAAGNKYPWSSWLTTEPASFPIAALKARRWAPGEVVSVPTGNALHYYSVASIGADRSTDAKTALQGIYIF